MKMIFRIVVLLFAFITAAAAQENPSVGFIRIVNAISPGVGKATFLIDGKNLHKDGYALGQTTGGYGVRTGSKTIKVTKEGLEPGTTKVSLGQGETMTVIVFAEKLPNPDPQAPPKWGIKLLRLKQQDVERGYGLSLVSVCKAEEISVKLAVVSKGRVENSFAKRLGINKVDLGAMRGEILVKVGDQVLTTVSPDSPGNYVVIFYENVEEKTEALYFFDPKFVIAG